MHLSKAAVSIISAALLLISASDTTITIENGGYSNVVVSISPDVPADVHILTGLIQWIRRGSEQLFRSTRCHLYLRNITILLPQTWGRLIEVHAPATNVSHRDGHIRVEPGNPLYGKRPYTEQSLTKCCAPGDVIKVSPDFITLAYPPNPDRWPWYQANFFVHEWGQFRYGLHEEYGFPGDNRYPAFRFGPDDNGDIVMMANACTNKRLTYKQLDFTNGLSCGRNPETGLPDKDCIFIPNQDGNQDITSSLMGAPFLQNATFFCDDDTQPKTKLSPSADSELLHLDSLMNKQNTMCYGRAAQQCLENHPDYADFTPGDASLCNNGDPYDPDITILKSPTAAEFVVLIDTSCGSHRTPTPTVFTRVYQAVKRWVKLDLRTGATLSIVEFDYENELLVNSTILNEENDRNDVVDTIDSDTDDQHCGESSEGATRLFPAIEIAIDLLGGGGYIVIMTAAGPYDPVDNGIMEKIQNSGVRITTIIVGDDVVDTSSEIIANITEWSDGTRTIVPNVDDTRHVNEALRDALKFEAPLPSSETPIVIFSKTYNGLLKHPIFENDDEFVIDATIGRNITFQLDFDNYECHAQRDTYHGHIDFVYIYKETDLAVPVLEYSFDNDNENDNDLVHVFKFSESEITSGTYRVKIKGDKDNPKCNMTLVITSLAVDEETMAIEARCWTSADRSGPVQLSENAVSIFSQVTQGNKPIKNAEVTAIIEGATTANDNPNPLLIDLWDNGAGADLIANDGIYSRFFYTSEDLSSSSHYYTVSCHARSRDGSAEVLVGLVDQAYVESLDIPICCGSDTASLGDNASWKSTGNFSRPVAASSLLQIEPLDEEWHPPPARVLDLILKLHHQNSTAPLEVQVEFTAPGNFFDQGKEMLQNDGTLQPVDAGTKVSLTILTALLADGMLSHVYFGMRAQNNNGIWSEISNVAEIFVK